MVAREGKKKSDTMRNRSSTYFIYSLIYLNELPHKRFAFIDLQT